MPKIGAICLKRPLLLLQETHWRPPTSISKPELLEPQRCANDKRGKVNSLPEKLWETHPREQICCVLHFFPSFFGSNSPQLLVENQYDSLVVFVVAILWNFVWEQIKAHPLSVPCSNPPTPRLFRGGGEKMGVGDT